MTDPTTGNDNALDAALRGMPRPAVDAARREAHIAAALGALDETSEVAEHPNVVSLASRRRPRLATLTAVAAAGLIAVGVGIGRVSAPDAPAPANQIKNATLTTTTATSDGPAVPACPTLELGGPAQLVTEFGTYVLVRTGMTKAGETKVGELVVVDTATCSIVTRVDLAPSGG